MTKFHEFALTEQHLDKIPFFVCKHVNYIIQKEELSVSFTVVELTRNLWCNKSHLPGKTSLCKDWHP